MYSYRDLPDNSKVWVYQSSKEFSLSQIKEIKKKTESFVEGWSAHGSRLRAAIEIFYNRFIVIMVDEAHAEATGCSIDKSFQFIKDLQKDFEIMLLDRLLVAYRDNGRIYSCRIDEFEELIKDGIVNKDTIVFNNLVDTKRDFDTKWEVLIKDSWHIRLFD